MNCPQRPPAIVRGRIDDRRSRDLPHLRRLICSAAAPTCAASAPARFLRAGDSQRQEDCANRHD
jgi:hypothetical protein